MPRTRSIVLLAFALAGQMLLCLPSHAQQTSAPTVDADAVTALTRMGGALRALDNFTLSARTITDYVLDDGQKLALTGTVNYKVREPDHFFVEVQSDKQHRQLFYDGKTLTIYSPRLKYYATVDDLNMPTQALLAESATTYGVDFPLADLFLWGTPAFPTDRFTSAMLVGTETIDGERSKHYAYRMPGVDWQVWISDATQLPRQVVITSHNDPALPDYVATLHWETKRAVSPKELAFNPSGATRIVFVPVAVAAQTANGGN
jgi:hypothetical protein